MSDFLTQMGEASRVRVLEAQSVWPMVKLKEQCQWLPATTPLAVPVSFGVLAEIKVTSPAEGSLDQSFSLDSLKQRTNDYIAGGAQALSVLTEPSRFDGTLEHLRFVSALARAHGVPVMRKDFLVDVYQIYEARHSGADGVLLICRILSDENLEIMIDTALQLGLFVLLEAFDQQDLNRCANYVAPYVFIGLNCRNLANLKIEPSRFYELIDDFPPGAIKVAESGIIEHEHVFRLAQAGYQVALIGSSLMRSDHPVKTLQRFIDAGIKGSKNR